MTTKPVSHDEVLQNYSGEILVIMKEIRVLIGPLFRKPKNISAVASRHIV